MLAVIGFATIYLLTSARKWFTRPKVQDSPDELAAIERELRLEEAAAAGRRTPDDAAPQGADQNELGRVDSLTLEVAAPGRTEIFRDPSMIPTRTPSVSAEATKKEWRRRYLWWPRMKALVFWFDGMWSEVGYHVLAARARERANFLRKF